MEDRASVVIGKDGGGGEGGGGVDKSAVRDGASVEEFIMAAEFAGNCRISGELSSSSSGFAILKPPKDWERLKSFSMVVASTAGKMWLWAFRLPDPGSPRYHNICLVPVERDGKALGWRVWRRGCWKPAGFVYVRGGAFEGSFFPSTTTGGRTGK